MDKQTKIDPRTHAFRDDLADERLKGVVEAERYVPGDEAHVHQDRVPLFGSPDFDAELMTEALFGEGVRIFEIADGWAWGQLMLDDYVGYLPLEALSPGFMVPTHRVCSLRTFIYSRADIKSPPIDLVSMMCQFAIVGEQGDFFELATGGFVVKRHVVPIDKQDPDFVSVAERFVGTPYLWGGRTSVGLDCSALIQLGLMATGNVVRRDSDLQQQTIGELLSGDLNISQLQRGDLVFWKGHIGVMVDQLNLLHANAHHMEVAVEPLVTAIERIRGAGSGEITALRRLLDYKSGQV